MGIVVRLLCISLLVGICLAVNGAPQQSKTQAPLEPRMTEISKLKQDIKSAGSAKYPHNPNSPDLVVAGEVGMGQLPDDVKAKLPQWIPARTVPFLPEAASTGGANSPCCICPQCGLSFYTPNDYWGHIPTCSAPGPKPCIQTTPCLGNSHFEADPRVCMCRPGPAPSSSAAAPTTAATGTTVTGTAPTVGSSSSSSDTSSSSGGPLPPDISSSSSVEPPAALNGSLILTGSIGAPLTGGGVPEMIEYPDIQDIGEEVGEQAAEAIGSGTDQSLFGY